MTLIIGAEHGTEEWREQRRGIVTASAVGRLITQRHLSAIDYACPQCGAPANNPCTSKAKSETRAPIKSLHTERTAVAAARRDETPPRLMVADNEDSRGLTATLVAERITGRVEDVYVSADMWRGVEDEPRAVEHYSQHYARVEACGLMVEDKWGFPIGYSPDGLVGDDGLIEVKSRQPKRQIQTFLAGEVPVECMAQLQCGLLVSGRAWIDYVSYAAGLPMYVHRVLPDPRWFEVIVAAVERFETTAAEMVATYTRVTKGLPLTERTEMEMSI